MKLQLPNSVSSTQDLAALTLELREYAKWFSHNAIKHQVHAKHATPPPTLSPGALELIRSISGKKLLDQAMLDQAIADLNRLHSSATSVTVTLAAPATGDLKQALVAWCRTHIADNVLVSFSFNSTLLGGMVIRYGSHMYDWSFRREILANRAKFAEVLRRV